MSDTLAALLEMVRDGRVGVAEALERLAVWPYEDVDFARLDHHRALRGGFPEVVYGPGKAPEHVAEALARIAAAHDVALATRVSPEQARETLAALPDARHDDVARALYVDRRPADRPRHGRVVVVAAGTADRPVAEEAALTADLVGAHVARLNDVGVAGLHRLLEHLEALAAASALVVVAGMEGALPGVVAGLVAAPVIAVPTSVGYGVHLGGIAPLLTMLNACAPGIAVVNIDGGFSGGYMAALIARAGAVMAPATDPAAAVDGAAR